LLGVVVKREAGKEGARRARHQAFYARFINVHSDWNCKCTPEIMFVVEVFRCLAVPSWA